MKRNVICLVSVACFACLALSAAAEPRLALKPEKLPKGGNVVVCKNVAYGPRQIGKGMGGTDPCDTVDVIRSGELWYWAKSVSTFCISQTVDA